VISEGAIYHSLDEVAAIEATTIEAMIWLIKDRPTVVEAIREMERALDGRRVYREKLKSAMSAQGTPR